MGEIEKRARELLEALANRWQDEAARSWGETKEHATLQRCADELHALLADAAALRSAQVPEVNPLREYAKRNLRKLIELGSTDKALMLLNLEEL